MINCLSGMKFLRVTLLILFSFMESKSERFAVVGPDASLVAVVDEDLVLPCFIKPNTSAVDLRIQWFRLDLKDSFIHLYKDKKDRNERQDQSYRGRTSLFKEELQKGNTSLKLSALQVSDEGDYKCIVDDGSWYDDITVRVTVAERFKVVGPDAPLVSVFGEDLVLPCFIQPNTSAVDLRVQWFRQDLKDSSVHLYEDHKERNEKQNQLYRGRTSLFKEELQKGNTSLKLSVLRHSDEGEYKCFVWAKSWHGDITVLVTVKDKVLHGRKIVLSISALALIVAVGLIIAGYFHQKKEYLRKTNEFAVDVILDPDTANPYLILSEDGKQVKHGDKQPDLPDTEKRFDRCAFVLAKQGFSSGRFYYEVQVSGKPKWRLGVVRESINRKGDITPSPQDGFWTVALRNEIEYKAFAGPPVPLSLKQKVEKVGVFVDYEEGLVSFYDVEIRSHIYSYTGQSFTEKIYPFFGPCYNDGGLNSEPLIILPVNHRGEIPV